jgi:magnesium-transporting ATPase (P-type)
LIRLTVNLEFLMPNIRMRMEHKAETLVREDQKKEVCQAEEETSEAECQIWAEAQKWVEDQIWAEVPQEQKEKKEKCLQKKQVQQMKWQQDHKRGAGMCWTSTAG